MTFPHDIPELDDKKNSRHIRHGVEVAKNMACAICEPEEADRG